MSRRNFFSMESLELGNEVQLGEMQSVGVDLATVDTVTASSLADVADIESTVQELQVEISGDVVTIEQVEEAGEVADDLADVGDKMVETADAGEEPTEASVETLNMALAMALRNAGDYAQRAALSQESFAHGRNRRASLKASGESVLETAKDMAKTVIEFVKKMVSKVMEFFKRTLGTGARLEAAAKKLVERVIANGDKEIKDDLEIPARRFAGVALGEGNAKVEKDLTVSQFVTNVTSHVKNLAEVRTGTDVFIDAMHKLIAGGNEKPVSETAKVGGFDISFEVEKEAGADKSMFATCKAVAVGKERVGSETKITGEKGKKVSSLRELANAIYAEAKEAKKMSVESSAVKSKFDDAIKSVNDAVKAIEKDEKNKDAKSTIKENRTLAIQTAKALQGVKFKVQYAVVAQALSACSALAASTAKAE